MKPPYYQDNYYILSGAPGSGKSTILRQLRCKGYNCVDESAREIIAEQRSIDGQGLYNRDKKLFLELMLSRSIYQYKQFNNTDKPHIFDRGIPDMIGYAKLFEVDMSSSINAAKIYQYNQSILFLPSWQEIYIIDEDRTMSFEAAKIFGDLIRQAYIDLGYKIIDVPLLDIDQRVKFIVEFLQ
jgi:predicted ATPase